MSVMFSQCARCGDHSQSHTMSQFNEDLICLPCKDIERKHPDYEKAFNAEMRQIKNGNMNYRGIGLPDNYSEFVESLKETQH